MEWVQFRGRRAVQVETDQLRMIVTQEGGHIAELLHKDTAISPLWVPEWPSLEPSAYSPVRHPEYGGGPESQLLAGLLGHNICLDLSAPLIRKKRLQVYQCTVKHLSGGTTSSQLTQD
jgi:hypothetical protein